MRCPPWPYDSQAAQMLYPTSVLGGLRGEAFGSVCVAHVPSRSRCVTDAACRRAVMGGRCVAPFRAHLQRYGTRACTALCLCFPNILGRTSLRLFVGVWRRRRPSVLVCLRFVPCVSAPRASFGFRPFARLFRCVARLRSSSVLILLSMPTRLAMRTHPPTGHTTVPQP